MEIQIFIFCALFTVCYGSQCEKVYKIFVKGRVVLQRNITLQTEEMPNMQRPVVWQNGDRKFECDQTCYKYGRYEVWQFGNISTLLIKNMSDYDLSWTFNDNKPCYARVSLKKEGWRCEKEYKIVPMGKVVLGTSITLLVDKMPYIERPVVWRNRVRNVECNISYCEYDKYVVRQSERTSTLYIVNITREDLFWRFHDNSSCNATGTLVTEGWRCEKEYKIVPMGKVVLGTSITLLVDKMPYIERPVVWRNRVRNVECNISYCEYDKYVVRQSERTSTLYIVNITREDLFWRFHDNSSCNATGTLVTEDNKTTTKGFDVAISGTYSKVERFAMSFGIVILAAVFLGAFIMIYFWYKSKGIQGNLTKRIVSFFHKKLKNSTTNEAHCSQ